VNRGFNTVKNEWEEAIGKAKFRGSDKEAKLKVSFFGPFYSGYNVIAIDNDYQYALVAGKNLDYLWILSRTTTIPTSIKTDYLEKAKSLGYDVEKLVWVTHNNQSK
jgi:apolipoprotein D and lipocalin family protein